MTRKISYLLFLVSLVFSFCQKKASVPAQATPSENNQAATQIPTDAETATSFAIQTAAAKNETSIKIKTAVLLPEALTILDDVTAVPVLADPGLENVNFQYQWFVNGRKIPEITGNKLEKNNFKKKAWLYYWVKALSEAGESAWRKSDIIRVLNSPPTLNMAPVGNFTVPGVFQYQIGASDPDKDILTYELIAPLDAGIELDKKSGLLTWNLENKIIEKLGETIVISLSVSDNDAQPTTGSITLRFQKKQQ